MNTSVFSRTPSVAVYNARGQGIREIQYHRHPDTPDSTEARMIRYGYGVRGFLLQSADPRLHAAGRINFVWLTDLTGTVLHTDSVDAGTSVALSDAAGRPVLVVTATGTVRTWQYEPATLPGRLLSVTEKALTGPAFVTERFVYAENTDEFKGMNLAGACLSHYDITGLVQTNSIALTGVPLSVSRRLLKDADKPDTVANWPGQDALAWNDRLDSETYLTLATADAAGMTLSTTDARGNTQRVAYDVAGQLSQSWLRLSGEGEAEQVIVASLTYSAAGQKLREVHGNHVVTTWTYEPQTQRLTGMTTERQATPVRVAKVLRDLRYEYDPVGNVLKVTNDAEETRFWRSQKVVPESRYTYDSLYQLVSVTGREQANAGQQRAGQLPSVVILPVDSNTFTNYSRTYRYDTAANLTQISHCSPTAGNSHTTYITVSDSSNRAVVRELAPTAAQVEAQFTAGGQQTQLLTGQTLSWNRRGELSGVTPAAGNSECYRYDSQSRRVLKVQRNNSVQTQRVVYLSGLELRSTARGSAAPENLQVITVGEAESAQVRVLHWESGLPVGIDNNQVRYSYGDVIQSTGLELDGEGNVISQEEYYPFGGTAVLTGRSAIEVGYRTLRYSGKERDATGLYYYGYRYYQPWAGRWLSADPAGTVDGLNLFRMVRNNPVSLYDNEGLNGREISEGWSMVFGAEKELTESLTSEQFISIAKDNKPKIFITGDGHASPPFKYAKEIPDVMFSVKKQKVNLYVEFTNKGWSENVAAIKGEHSSSDEHRELPAEFIGKKLFGGYKYKANVVPWEPDISNLASSMFDIVIDNAGDFSHMKEHNRSKLNDLAMPFKEEMSRYATELASDFQNNMNNLLTGELPQHRENAGKRLITILSGEWRDSYINHYLANKIAENAQRSPDETFLISVGDAHLEENLNNVQGLLANLRKDGKYDFTHQILVNKNSRLGHR